MCDDSVVVDDEPTTLPSAERALPTTGEPVEHDLYVTEARGLSGSHATSGSDGVALALLGVRAMHSEGAAPVGQTIGRYHLHRQIARGGMARIHIARSLGAEGFSRIVAAKRLDPQLALDEEFVEMFLDEARVASKIRHRNVVPVLDVVTIDGEVIMVQELVHGTPLHKLFTRARQAGIAIPVPIAISIATQVLAGLHAAHECVDETGMSLNIIHRDVSPQNIMIATDGTARLLDFGVAKTAAAAHITRTGTFKGKLTYSSPEQLSGHVTRQTDLYALAVILWELLTGERMHAGRSEAEVFAAITTKQPPRLARALAWSQSQGELDAAAWRAIEALDPVLDRAFSRDLTERYATAAEMERALVAAAEPAPLADVAAWMRSLAQDLLDQTEQLIAAEEASWRKWRDSGIVPAIGTGSQRTLPRSSTSLETEAAKPSARWRAKLFARGSAVTGDGREHVVAKVRAKLRAMPATSRAWLAQMPPIAFALIDGIVVLMIVVLLLGRSSSPHHAAAATLPSEPTRVHHLQVQPAMPVAAAVSRAATNKQPVATREQPVVDTTPERPKRTTPPTAKRRTVVRRPAKKLAPAAAKPDCSIPFYYEGSKKIFKPSCL